jgi:pimeloyl-ACP methyl ester carboxylesterase
MVDRGQGTVARGARQIGWRRVGGGAPLVLLNGYAATAADWDPGFLDALSAPFELVLIDHRGMGTSSWGDDAELLTIEAMAADVVAVLDALGLARVPVVGWSMGGFVAQALAAGAPDRVQAMGLLGTDPGGPGAVLADPEVWAQLTDTSGSAREQATRLLQVLFPAALAAELDEQVGALVADGRAALDHHVLRAQEAAMAAWHRNEPVALGDRPPTLVAAGRLDAVIPPANAALLAERWHAPAPTLYDGGGHAFMAQVPQELAAELIDHLGH